MTEYPEPPRTDWGDHALLSDAEDPEDYQDVWGLVQDQENWKGLQEQIIVPFDSYSEFPAEGPFDGARAEAKDMNVVFEWDASAADWTPLNTGTSEDPVPGTTHLEAASVESTDSEQYHNAYSVSINPSYGTQANADGWFTPDRSMRPIGMHNWSADNTYARPFFYDEVLDIVYYVDSGGALVEWADVSGNSNGDINHVSVEKTGEILAIHDGGSGDFPLQAHLYGSLADFESGSDTANRGTYRPRPFNLWAFGGDNRNHMWAEYTNDPHNGQHTVRQYYRGNFEFIEALSVPDDDDIRHLHNLDQDPFTGRWWVTSGDSSHEIRWWLSDGVRPAGNNDWTEFDDIRNRSDRIHRTLRIGFTDSHVYWSQDDHRGHDSTGAGFFRAPKSDPNNEELLFGLGEFADPDLDEQYHDDIWSYGTTRTWQPNGFVVTSRVTGNESQFDWTPIVFFDLETEQPRRVAQFPVSDTTQPGVRDTPQYQCGRSGNIYFDARGYRTEPQSGGINSALEFDIQRLQH